MERVLTSERSAAADPADRRWGPAHEDELAGAAAHIVDLAASMSGMRTWYVGRFVGDAVVPIAVTAGAVGVAQGHPLAWATTVCRRMVSRLGPPIALDIAAVPNYARTQLARDNGLTCYAGVPLLSPQDRLLGVAAGWDSRGRPAAHPALEQLLWTLSRLMTPLFEAADRKDRAARADERSVVRQRAREVLTAAPGRRGWGLVLAGEDARVREHGHAVAVIVIDIGRVRSAQQVATGTRIVTEAVPQHVVARLGPRDVAVLVPGDDVSIVADIASTILESLTTAGYEASAAWATRTEAADLREVWMLAQDRLLVGRRAWSP